MIVSITNLNETPVISNQSFTVPENLPNGVAVGTVVASDPDEGQVLTYSIQAGNTSNAFIINSSTGNLSINNSAAINYQINPLFTLTVRVTDNGTGNLFSEALMTINVIQSSNLSPVIVNQQFSVSENSANGTLVGIVVATDPNAGQTLTYAILSGNNDSTFLLNEQTGELFVIDSTLLDYENNPSFGLTIQVQDNGNGNLSSQAFIMVTVDDINEPPTITDPGATGVHTLITGLDNNHNISENTPNGTTVFQVLASDPDSGQILSYAIIGGNNLNAFAINSVTGEVTVANSSALNYEAVQNFALVIRVSDNGQPELSCQGLFNINILDMNEAPLISNQSFELIENATPGTIVGTVQASDPDNGQILTYLIEAGNDGGTFAINSLTGVLTVQNSALLVLSIHPVFNLIVTVQDNGSAPMAASAVMTINLRPDGNNKIVYIDPSISGDAGENGTFKYPYNSWYDFTFADGVTYLQKRGTTFEVINPIIVDQKTKINLGAYGIGSMPVIYGNRSQMKILDLEDSKNCNISDLEIKSNGNALACIYFSGNSSSENTIENCFLHHSQNGVMSVGVNGNTIVRYNKISNNTTGINADGLTTKIYYNQFVSNNTAIKVQKYKKADVTNNTFVGNTLYAIESMPSTEITSMNNIYYLDAQILKHLQKLLDTLNNFLLKKSLYFFQHLII